MCRFERDGQYQPETQRTADGAALQCVREARFAARTAWPLQDAQQ